MPTHHIISVIYKFRCQCDVDYVVRTGQWSEAPINQHLPANIDMGKVDNLHWCINLSGSVIAEHLITNQQSTWSYSSSMLSMLSMGYQLYILSSTSHLSISRWSR